MSNLGKKRIIKSGLYYYPQVCVIRKSGFFKKKESEEWALYSEGGHPIYSWTGYPNGFLSKPAGFCTLTEAKDFFKEIEPEEVYEVK